jgi:hypothetical protein
MLASTSDRSSDDPTVKMISRRTPLSCVRSLAVAMREA